MGSWFPRLCRQGLVDQLNERVADNQARPALNRKIGQLSTADLLNASQTELFGCLNTSGFRRWNVIIMLRSAFAAQVLDETPGLQEHFTCELRFVEAD